MTEKLSNLERIKTIDRIKNQHFERFTVCGVYPKTVHCCNPYRSLVLCKCDCGNLFLATLNNLLDNRVKSCHKCDLDRRSIGTFADNESATFWEKRADYLASRHARIGHMRIIKRDLNLVTTAGQSVIIIPQFYMLCDCGVRCVMNMDAIEHSLRNRGDLDCGSWHHSNIKRMKIERRLKNMKAKDRYLKSGVCYGRVTVLRDLFAYGQSSWRDNSVVCLCECGRVFCPAKRNLACGKPRRCMHHYRRKLD